MYNFAEIKRNRKYTHFGILPYFLKQTDPPISKQRQGSGGAI
jgi:hypothetical protein